MSRRTLIKLVLVLASLTVMTLFLTGCAATGDAVDTEAGQSDSVAQSLVALLGSRQASVQTVALLTILSLAPSILMMFTCFTRIIIVLSFSKNALGMQQMPPSAVLVGLALMLTFFIMGPVVDQIKVEAYEPYIAEEIDADEAAERALVPIKSFMLRQVYIDDLNMFIEMDGTIETLESFEEVPLRVLTPAFITSEIKRGFMMGFFIYVPFIVIDMIVASVLMSMGMMMLPPTVISLPFKVLLFVMVDGWALTIQTLVVSFA